MEAKKVMIFALTIVSIILGVTLFKQFDFQNFTFEKPALAIVYSVTFIVSVSVIVKNLVKK